MPINEGLAQGEIIDTNVANPLPAGTNSIGQVTANAGTNLNTSSLALETTQVTTNTRIGDLTETSPGSDTASSGLNGRLQRIAQRITSLISALSDRTAKFQITNGTNDSAVTNSLASLTAYGLNVRPIPFESLKYAAATDNFAIAANATDIFEIKGSGSKTIRVKKVVVSGRTTSGSPVTCIIKTLKRSTANTGGTSVTTTNVPFDSTSSAATAAVKHYTANPTVGTLVGNIATRSITFQSAGLLQVIEIEFENPVILRGTSELLCVNFNATSITGSSICCNAEWEEV